MIYIINGVFRTLPREVIEHELKKVLINSSMKVVYENLIIEDVSYIKNEIIIYFRDLQRSLSINKIKKIEIDNTQSTVKISSSTVIYNIDIKK